MDKQKAFTQAQRVFDHFYKSRFKHLLKASDFYVPFFFGKKKRIEEFSLEYKPLATAAFTEALRNYTVRKTGKPDEELIAMFVNKNVPDTIRPFYDSYWDLINSELEKNPENSKELVSSLATLFMYRLFGPESTEPNPDILNSHRHQIAVDFQVGNMMFEYTQGLKTVLDKLK